MNADTTRQDVNSKKYEDFQGTALVYVHDFPTSTCMGHVRPALV